MRVYTGRKIPYDVIKGRNREKEPPDQNRRMWDESEKNRIRKMAKKELYAGSDYLSNQRTSLSADFPAMRAFNGTALATRFQS